jgi:hypothetical protein
LERNAAGSKNKAPLQYYTTHLLPLIADTVVTAKTALVFKITRFSRQLSVCTDYTNSKIGQDMMRGNDVLLKLHQELYQVLIMGDFKLLPQAVSPDFHAPDGNIQ